MVIALKRSSPTTRQVSIKGGTEIEAEAEVEAVAVVEAEVV